MKDIKIFLKKKKKKKQYGRERYKNLSEEKKQLSNEKKFHMIIIRKYFNLENFSSL